MKTDNICYYCKHLCSHGYHHWGCRLTGDTTDANDTCPNWEEE